VDTAAITLLGSALLTLLALTLVCGALLGAASERFRVQEDPVVESINALLPQTQCGQCGHPGCKPYAQAIARGEAINRCPPGGQTTINALAELLDRAPATLDPSRAKADRDDVPRVAFIREEECIGCTKCIQACPVDAIVGAARFTHTVIAAECTGCDLCVEPCPVDCIDMITPDGATDRPSWPLPPDLPHSALWKQSLIATDRQGETR